MTPSETIRCSKLIYSPGMFRGAQCYYTMKVMRDNKPYCNKHDPEQVKAKRDARSAKWQAEHDAQRQIEASASALAATLGAGRPEYSTLSGKGRYTGSIVLTADEVQQIIARLTKAKR